MQSLVRLRIPEEMRSKAHNFFPSSLYQETDLVLLSKLVWRAMLNFLCPSVITGRRRWKSVREPSSFVWEQWQVFTEMQQMDQLRSASNGTSLGIHNSSR